jgi:dephospho-CoA kinase
MTFVIGLTGGIGCGKTTAARLFAELGAEVIDTDEIAHRLTGPNAPALAEIFRQFGDGCRQPDGSLDRAKLRSLVFSDRDAKTRLESILHPLIRKEVVAALKQVSAPYAIVVVPLLLETGGYRDLVQRVLMVDCDEAQQVARTMERSRLSADEVQAIMANQLSRAERLRRADDVLPNRGDPADLAHRVRALHEHYLTLAGRKPSRKS